VTLSGAAGAQQRGDRVTAATLGSGGIKATRAPPTPSHTRPRARPLVVVVAAAAAATAHSTAAMHRAFGKKASCNAPRRLVRAR
jgi:hypothetical protein